MPTVRKIGIVRRVVGLVLVGVLWLATGDAMAAVPIKGGHYHFVRTLERGKSSSKIDLELTLANDARELAYPSGVSEQLACGRHDSFADGIAFDGAVDAPFRALPIAPTGRFSARGLFLGGARRFHLSGTFTPGGRFAVGTLTVRGGKGSCPVVRLHFRAPLVGRPNTPHRGDRSLCDRVTIRQLAVSGNDETYRVYDKGIGCTTAREIARQWHTSPTCRRLGPGGRCNLDGATCQSVTGGQFSSLASAQCTSEAHPGGVAELVHFQPCSARTSGNGADITMWAVNLECAAASAFPVDGLLGDPESGTGPCRAINELSYKASACSPLGGYVCRARTVEYEGASGFYAVCVQEHDGFRALVFYYEF